MGPKTSREYLDALHAEIRKLYLSDGIPWVIGYSGGKDSTTVVQLVWNALAELPEEKRDHKPVHVISTNTLVEQPVVASWVDSSLEQMQKAANEHRLPIIAHRLTPKKNDTYWVNLIGKGYPAPRPQFRWCTSRLKIDPANRFIVDMVKAHGETIMVLGTRKAESAARAATMEKYEQLRVRGVLSPNGSLSNSWVYSPIEDWSSDDVWFYLLQYPNPWGISNKDLMAMYRGASADNECPLVVDTSTPSCGNSRFGCWVCTMVTSDKSMEAMIHNDSEKQWMLPLLEFRNEIGFLVNGHIEDRRHRDYRRMHGDVKLLNGRAVHGPYTKHWREHLLRRLLEVELDVNTNGPEEMRNYRLVTDDELREIRRIWVEDKHEFDDALPRIYAEVKGKSYPYWTDIKTGPFGPAEWALLRELCGANEVYFELQASLIDVEQRARLLTSKRNILDELEQIVKRCYFESEEDAVAYAMHRVELRDEAAAAKPGLAEGDNLGVDE
jgi:DNA sulfur modification protein DndC